MPNQPKTPAVRRWVAADPGGLAHWAKGHLTACGIHFPDGPLRESSRRCETCAGIAGAHFARPAR